MILTIEHPNVYNNDIQAVIHRCPECNGLLDDMVNEFEGVDTICEDCGYRE